MAYNVQLDVFEGPLDLLLYLIRKNEVDLYDIPIARITEEYLEHLDVMKNLRLDVAGEFLVLASLLTYIKSRMLLPRTDEDEADEAGADPRNELVRLLLEYRKYKEAATDLSGRMLLDRDVFARGAAGAVDVDPAGPEGGALPLEVSLFELVEAFRAMLKALPAEKLRELERETFSVADKMSAVLERLGAADAAEGIFFHELFGGVSSRSELVATFLALLELVRLKALRAGQDRAWGPIRIRLAVTVEEGRQRVGAERGTIEDGYGKPD